MAEDATAAHVAAKIEQKFAAGERISLGMEDGTYRSDSPVDQALLGNVHDKYFLVPSLTDPFMVFYNKVCRALLDKAAGRAETHQQKQRIGLFSKTFKLSEYLFRMAAKKKVTQAEVDEVLKYAKTVIMPDPMTVYRQNNPQDAYDRIEHAVWTLAGQRGLAKPRTSDM